MEAWHFVGDTLRDGRPVPADGGLLRHDGNLELCALGLHASERVMDALQYAPGNTICRVQIGGKILRGDDKLCATERTILWRIDAETVLLEFARWAALQVAHLWECPEVVRTYLETGDQEIKDAAWDAASDDVWDVAWDAARNAARNAAMDDARYAARYAASVAAGAAARAAANAAARDAARDDEMDAAWDAAWAAAWDAACYAQNERLTAMIIAAHKASL